MNKHEKEVLAIQKRLDARIEYEKWRKEKVKDGYQCYLAYMKSRKML
jgi:hypothetical protein|tara:strand:- start:279 stop:419 length:141 start_codon:yes stop_codon:yes gene_type:complete